MALSQRSWAGPVRPIPVYRSSAGFIVGTRPLPSVAQRTFSWWWRSGGYDWSSRLDDSFQRHVLRKQKILRFKYSKAIRRRQLWDRDPSHNALRPTWGWPILDFSNPCNDQARSTKASPQETPSRQIAESEEALDEFSRFKAYVDKDPFAAVFGRRRSDHQSSIGRSWSSSAWTADFSPPVEGRKVLERSTVSNTAPSLRPTTIRSSGNHIPSQSTDAPANNSEHQQVSPSKPSVTPIKSSIQDDEYEFDPISMRKIPKPKSEVASPTKAPNALFDPLFVENGIDTPVKPYKPHRVFGHSAPFNSGVSQSKCSTFTFSEPKPGKPTTETSRLAELRKLKAATLGNSLDTTAEYYGKWTPETDKHTQEPSSNPAAHSSTNDAPLFSGTTYEAKSKDILKDAQENNQGWLHREGFGRKPAASMDITVKVGRSGAKPENQRPPAKLEPSLDRLHPSEQRENKLESSINRATWRNPPSSAPSQKPFLPASDVQGSDYADLDILRASDVRASSRSARRNKQDSEQAKINRRQMLENDFQPHQQDDAGLPAVFPSTIMESSRRLSDSLNKLWHRVQVQPKAWLAEKAQSLNKSQDSTVDNEPMDAKQDTHETSTPRVKPSSSTPNSLLKPTDTFSASPEVMAIEEQSRARTLALQNATLERNRLAARVEKMDMELAGLVKAAYEDEYGPITINHRQSKGVARIDQLARELDGAKDVAAQRDMGELAIRCQDAIKAARSTHLEVKQKLKSIEDRMLSADSLAPSAPTLTSEPPLLRSHSTETSASEVPVGESVAKSGHTSSSSRGGSPNNNIPLLYKVLAYDSSTLQMTIAETTSSMSASGDPESQPLHPTEVLTRLNNVAKFLPYFAHMEKQGYEIVSGSGDVLVFKKVRLMMGDSADVTGKPSDVVTDATPKVAPNDAGTPKVHRQEDVFSGSGQSRHQEDANAAGKAKRTGREPGWFRRTIRRMFLAGTVTAATAYAIGVAAEYAGARVPESSEPRRGSRPGIYTTEDSR